MSEVQMEVVSSSNVESIGHDHDNETMIVRFRTGAEYAYAGVSFDQYEYIKNAPSVGAEVRKLQGVRI